MRKAHIVWNESRTEGVIFVEDEIPTEGIPTAEDDAFEAATGTQRHRGVGSALAQAFQDCYGGESDGDETDLPVDVVPYDALNELIVDHAGPKAS